MAVNKCIHWVCSTKTALFSKVIKECDAEISLINPEAFGRTILVQESYPSDLVVLELAYTQTTLDSKLLEIFWRKPTSPLSLILLPHHSTSQIIEYLDAGADRCMSIDSEIQLIQAMIRSMLHRCRGEVPTNTEHGLLRFEHDTNSLFHQSERIPLTNRESQVASLLFHQVKRYVRNEEILCVLTGGSKRKSSPALVSLYVHRINRKIRPYGVNIDFKRGYGYRLQVDSFEHSTPPKVEWLGYLPMSRDYSHGASHA